MLSFRSENGPSEALRGWVPSGPQPALHPGLGYLNLRSERAPSGVRRLPVQPPPRGRRCGWPAGPELGLSPAGRTVPADTQLLASQPRLPTATSHGTRPGQWTSCILAAERARGEPSSLAEAPLPGAHTEESSLFACGFDKSRETSHRPRRPLGCGSGG